MDKKLIKHKIESAFTNLKTAIQEHTDINIKRADGGWTVGEIANHIIKGTNVNLSNTKKTERPYDQNADSIKNIFLNFKMKFPTASVLLPDSKQYTKEEIFSSLDATKETISILIDTDDLTETCVDITLPVWGTLTKYEWFVLFEYHIIRHTRQINDFNRSSP